MSHLSGDIMIATLLAFSLYLFILLLIAFFSYKKEQTADDFMLGSRKMNFYLTAFAAHASDMSSWIFLAYPAMIFVSGFSSVTVAIGLTSCMFLNWHFIAPKLRTETEKYNSLTLSSYFESRFSDTSGLLRIFSSIACLIFFTVYVSAGLVSLGILLNTIFCLPYVAGVILGILIIIPYLFFGGYVTLAWTDCFQGIFLLIAIVLIPILGIVYFNLDIGSILSSPAPAITSQTASTTWYYPILEMFAWGLPYFGLPHVLTKFMGISDVKEMSKAKWVGISWQITALAAATFIGLIGKYMYENSGIHPEYIFIQMTQTMLTPFFATFVLCAILGATITCMDSQILVVATSLTEDIYKKVIKKNATSKELLFVSRSSIFLVAVLSCIIALSSKSSIGALVSYAWFGLGASFGPVVLFALFSKSTTKAGALAGLVTGMVSAAVWPLIPFPIEMPTMIPAFLLSVIAIKIFSLRTYEEGAV
jgi:sodium/proline symporter